MNNASSKLFCFVIVIFLQEFQGLLIKKKIIIIIIHGLYKKILIYKYNIWERGIAHKKKANNV